MKCEKICARGVSWKKPVQDTILRPITAATRLKREVESHEYTPIKLPQIIIKERGKERLIRPQTMKDRTLQTWLCKNFLTDTIMKNTIQNNFACLPGRGLDAALNWLENAMNKAEMTDWVWQSDFSGFFASIPQITSEEQLNNYTDDSLIKYLIHEVIRANVIDDKDKNNLIGLELGAPSSQNIAAFYPDPLDRAIIADPDCKDYGRYMDDVIVIANSKEACERQQEIFFDYSKKLGLKVNEKKTHMNKIIHPVVFCKHRFTKTRDGVIREIRMQQANRMIRHVKNVHRIAENNPSVNFDCVVASCRGYLQRDGGKLLRLLDGTLERIGYAS